MTYVVACIRFIRKQNPNNNKNKNKMIRLCVSSIKDIGIQVDVKALEQLAFPYIELFGDLQMCESLEVDCPLIQHIKESDRKDIWQVWFLFLENQLQSLARSLPLLNIDLLSPFWELCLFFCQNNQQHKVAIACRSYLIETYIDFAEKTHRYLPNDILLENNEQLGMALTKKFPHVLYSKEEDLVSWIRLASKLLVEFFFTADDRFAINPIDQICDPELVMVDDSFVTDDLDPIIILNSGEIKGKHEERSDSHSRYVKLFQSCFSLQKINDEIEQIDETIINKYIECCQSFKTTLFKSYMCNYMMNHYCVSTCALCMPLWPVSTLLFRDKITGGQTNLIPWHLLGADLVISGGSVVCAALDIPMQPSQDIDVWVCNQNRSMVTKFFQYYDDTFPAGSVLYVHMQSVVNIYIDGAPRHVQLIFVDKSAEKVTRDFDLDYVKTIYDGQSDHIRLWPEAELSWKTRKIWKVNPEYIPQKISVERLDKADKKGFSTIFIRKHLKHIGEKKRDIEHQFILFDSSRGLKIDYCAYLASFIYPGSTTYTKGAELDSKFEAVSFNNYKFAPVVSLESAKQIINAGPSFKNNISLVTIHLKCVSVYPIRNDPNFIEIDISNVNSDILDTIYETTDAIVKLDLLKKKDIIREKDGKKRLIVRVPQGTHSASIRRCFSNISVSEKEFKQLQELYEIIADVTCLLIKNDLYFPFFCASSILIYPKFMVQQKEAKEQGHVYFNVKL